MSGQSFVYRELSVNYNVPKAEPRRLSCRKGPGLDCQWFPMINLQVRKYRLL